MGCGRDNDAVFAVNGRASVHAARAAGHRDTLERQVGREFEARLCLMFNPDSEFDFIRSRGSTV